MIFRPIVGQYVKKNMNGVLHFHRHHLSSPVLFALEIHHETAAFSLKPTQKSHLSKTFSKPSFPHTNITLFFPSKNLISFSPNEGLGDDSTPSRMRYCGHFWEQHFVCATWLFMPCSIADRKEQNKAAYSLVFMTGDKLVAMRDPFGFWPSAMGRSKSAVVFASGMTILSCLVLLYLRLFGELAPSVQLHVMLFIPKLDYGAVVALDYVAKAGVSFQQGLITTKEAHIRIATPSALVIMKQAVSAAAEGAAVGDESEKD
ncbi:hypothetical protein SLEP1_g31057 [Rubroshorea leprosula]|uniref:Uncharacterized protein n=1 Tax=Rubroshorea leprosula TaxID=152421 RepID=A0AAV5K9V1_9ROSI|nr:hypothetical protein SLEP1_g31057 [Rubroshorea leprosula]